MQTFCLGAGTGENDEPILASKGPRMHWDLATRLGDRGGGLGLGRRLLPQPLAAVLMLRNPCTEYSACRERQNSVP